MNATMTITGRTVLIGMIAFFGVIFAVNGVFLYFALGTFPGLTSNRAYLDGLEYNRTLADGERQASLGWKAETGIAVLSDGDELKVRILDADGRLVPYLSVTVEIVRPATSDGAQKLDLVASADGHVAAIGRLEPGRWLVRILAARDGEQVYRVDDEVYVRP
ncbi:MAG: FixH family protein [Rhodospirillales bacterium]